MAYNIKNFFEITYLSFFRAKNTLARLTPKRLLVLFLFYLGYTILEVLTWASFGLDELFFPTYRHIEIRQPFFIIGNPRSGTTFLHRLLARDERNFISIKLWEILFAPSITQRRLINTISAADRGAGGLLHRLMRWIDRYVQASNIMHRISLFVPEEDEYFLIHQGSTIIAGLFFGFPKAAYRYVFFDTRLRRSEKRAIMRFYRHCLQRHLYAHGDQRHILSKNPYFSPKVDALYETFPDARIVYLVRNPLRVIPSYASLSAHWWRLMAEPKDRYPHPEYILRATQHWYRYPVDRLDRAPEESRIFVKFDDLITDPEGVVRAIYQHFGLEVSQTFAATLKEEAQKARHYKSRHIYRLEDMGLSREHILRVYRDVFERWGFSTEA